MVPNLCIDNGVTIGLWLVKTSAFVILVVSKYLLVSNCHCLHDPLPNTIQTVQVSAMTAPDLVIQLLVCDLN